MSKKLLFLFLILIYSNTTHAQNCETISDDFEKYTCRSEKSCELYNENKKIFNIEKFKTTQEYEASASIGDILFSSGSQSQILSQAINTYKENMNSIYKCAIIGAQKNSLYRIKQKLLQLDKTWDIKKTIEPKINELILSLNTTGKNNECINIDTNTVFNKLSILKQTTYLTCDYNFYMEYLKSYYNNPANALGITKEDLDRTDTDNKAILITEADQISIGIQKQINTEIERAYKIFPIAYHAYSEYENNFPIHFLLELLKEDFYILRQKLDEVLNPINQVVYKISNAMKE